MADHESAEEIWYPSKCPQCGKAGVRPMSRVGDYFHYRCPGPCLWSWVRPYYPGLYMTCHGALSAGQECSTCGAFHPAIKWKGDPA